LTLSGTFHPKTLGQVQGTIRKSFAPFVEFNVENLLLRHPPIQKCYCLERMIKNLSSKIRSFEIDLRSTHYAGFQKIVEWLVQKPTDCYESKTCYDSITIAINVGCNEEDLDRGIEDLANLLNHGCIATIVVDKPDTDFVKKLSSNSNYNGNA
jgi:hypothetical protein